MTHKKVKVTITGAAGQIGYSLLFRIASGQVFGLDTKVDLTLLEVEPALKAAEGVVMELQDCAFPLLENMNITSDLNEGFKNSNWALLVGAMPRKAGMERKDLLAANGKIFTGQGKAIEKNAASDVRILVVGNPCNTNCLIAMNNAKEIPSDRWFAMTKLDENRAKAQLSQKSGIPVSKITRMAIWGNHSATQYPNFYDSLIDGQNATKIISDQNWLKNDFIKTVQQRGAEIIKARGLSSAASAANGVVDTVRCIISPTEKDDFFSVALCSNGSYGIEKGLIFGFPVRSDGTKLEIVQGIELNDFSTEKIKLTEDELKQEKASIQELL